jgi:hypothetical protein
MLRSSLATAAASATVLSGLLVGLVGLAGLVACGNHAEPASPSLSDPAHAADLPTAGSAAMPSASADPEGGSAGGEEHHRQRKPFPIHSSCTDVVTVVFGEDPKAQGAGRRTVAPSSSIDGPRDADGKQTVWLLDDKGEPTVKVHITRGMKQLEIGRSCRTLDAR